jgi:hypothetical protein
MYCLLFVYHKYCHIKVFFRNMKILCKNRVCNEGTICTIDVSFNVALCTNSTDSPFTSTGVVSSATMSTGLCTCSFTEPRRSLVSQPELFASRHVLSSTDLLTYLFHRFPLPLSFGRLTLPVAPEQQTYKDARSNTT